MMEDQLQPRYPPIQHDDQNQDKNQNKESKSKVIAILGGQWGDEGKGKIVDWAGQYVDLTARATGGNNAGHTVYLRGKKHVFHLLPSAITWGHIDCILGNGMVIDPLVLLQEMKVLREMGYELHNLSISGDAHLIMLYHLLLESIQEQGLGEKGKIGTTGRGIGPAYTDKMQRSGIRINDLLQKESLALKIQRQVEEKCHLLQQVYRVPMAQILARLAELIPIDPASPYSSPVDLVPTGQDPADSASAHYRQRIMALSSWCTHSEIALILTDFYFDLGSKIKPYIRDVRSSLAFAQQQGKIILLEGAQGLLLDIDHGTYPFVTSSSPTVGGLNTGLGLARIDDVYSVVKAYTTRVGSGPFPTELKDFVGIYLRGKGGEYGATTGRPRRCGWHDAVLTRHAINTNGSKLIITKLDVLTGLKILRICNSYQYMGPTRNYNGEVYFTGKIIHDFPTDTAILAQCIPHEWVELPGWDEDFSKVKAFCDLPENARRYLAALEQLSNAKVCVVSVGPARDQTIIISGNWNLVPKKIVPRKILEEA